MKVEIPKGTETEAITIAATPGLMIPKPHAKLVGQPLTEAWAHVLDQTLAENARNNLREAIKKLKGDKPAAQKLLDEYLAQYNFGERRGGGFRAQDPVEAQAMADVKGAIIKALVKKGIPKKDIKASEVTAKAKEILAGPKGEGVRKRAAKTVADRDKDAETLVGDIS